MDKLKIDAKQYDLEFTENRTKTPPVKAQFIHKNLWHYNTKKNPPVIDEQQIHYACGIADKCISTDVMNFENIAILAMDGLRLRNQWKMIDAHTSHRKFTIDLWRNDAYNGDTLLSYEQWVDAQIKSIDDDYFDNSLLRITMEDVPDTEVNICAADAKHLYLLGHDYSTGKDGVTTIIVNISPPS